MKQAIVNGRIIGPATAGRGYVEWDGGVITAVGEGDYKGDAGLVTDAGGDWISPGFIDIHTHGAGGHDFMDCTVEAYLGAAEMSARHGATTIFPTTLASTNENLFETFEVFRRAQPLNTKGADMPGCISKAPISPTTNAAHKIRATCAIRAPRSTMRSSPPATIFAGCRWLPSSTVRSNWDGCCAQRGFWRRSPFRCAVRGDGRGVP